MSGRVLNLDSYLNPDNLGTAISNRYLEWEMYRQVKKQEWEEVRRYIFATDTTKTSNAILPWRNTTTIPKLCHIRDNLYANYSASLFPKRKWLIWEANEKDSNSVEKRDAITNYMAWAISQPNFAHEMDKLILDYIDYGNCFATVEWSDMRVETKDKTQMGYVGPSLRRISPLDIVFNPTAESFDRAPKIIRTLVSLGELKEEIEKLSNNDTQEAYKELWDYLREIRRGVRSFAGDVQQKDALYNVDGFSSFRAYLESDTVEILTFYGDLYDADNDIFLKNHIISIVDRHKVFYKKPNPSYFGYPTIFGLAWRKRQDNLWGMGPLDNLVGMQYRLDHIENLKADTFDQVVAPMIHISGPNVEDFNWEPFGRIYSDIDSKVTVLAPDVQVLQANLEIQGITNFMEEMAGAPKEAVGFRTPGEKTKYEVQRLENAASRVFQNKIRQFEEELVEPVLNAMLELAQRNLSGVSAIKVFDDEFKFATFQELTVEDITGIGRIKPMGARHFAEQAELVQNLTNLSASPLWAQIAPHISSIGLAKIFEDMFNLSDYAIVTPYIAISEQADAQRQMQSFEEQTMTERMTPSGLAQDDFSNIPQEESSLA